MQVMSVIIMSDNVNFEDSNLGRWFTGSFQTYPALHIPDPLSTTIAGVSSSSMTEKSFEN